MSSGVQGFIEALSERGLKPRQDGGLVLYRVTPAIGVHADTVIETGVVVDELSAWPQTPPHWVHLPADIRISNANSRKSPKTGWMMHSRTILGWGDTLPITCWINHARAVLGEAIE